MQPATRCLSDVGYQGLDKRPEMPVEIAPVCVIAMRPGKLAHLPQDECEHAQLLRQAARELASRRAKVVHVFRDIKIRFGDEAIWKLNILAPLARLAVEHPAHAEKIRQLAEDWSSGKLAEKPSIAWATPGKTKGLTGEQAFPEVWERFLSGNYSGKPATLGTIFHYAKEVGWVDITQSGLVVVNNQPSPLTVLHQGQSIEPSDFPNPPKPGKSVIPTTIPNVNYLLERYGIISRYNVIKKKIEIKVPDHSGTSENHDNVAMTHVISLAALTGLNTGLVPEFVAAIADQHPINPVADWISCKAWDGDDRLQAFYATLSTVDDYPSELKEILMYRWLVSAVAAVLKPSGFKGRGVLTLQGPQSIGKTSWISALVPDPILREQVIKLDHHLDAANKDSIITAVSHWIVEIGELDSSFKKDIARLKGFLTSNQDKIRKPYGRTNSEYPRKTVFCASVNDANFLVDSTGNTRWWTIPVVKVNYQHNIDMQQLFAQISEDDKADERWWLTPEEEASLENFNRRHRSISVIEDRIMAELDLERTDEANFPAMTPSQFLIEIGISHPTNAQCKEGAAIFRELFGDSKRINGQNKWRIPVKKSQYPGVQS
jgi:predicted P-loop ATPase